MFRKIILVVALLLVGFNVSAKEEEVIKVDKAPHPVMQFVYIEGMLTAMSGMFASSPKGFGWGMAVLSPAAASSELSDTGNLVGIGTMMSIGVYNAKELSKDNYSWNDRFKKNMYALHAWALTVAVTESIFGDIPFSKNVAIIPEKDGMHLAFNMNI